MKKILLIGVALSMILIISSSGLSNLNAEVSIIIPNDRDEQISMLEQYPYFLEDTILNGEYIVIVTEEGKAPADLEQEFYDYVLSFEEHDKIIEEARSDFLKKYRIDPIVSLPEPTEDVESYNKSANLTAECENSCSNHGFRSSSSPRVINGFILVWNVVPTTSYHRPSNPSALSQVCNIGWSRFNSAYQFSTLFSVIYGYWSPPSSLGDNVHQIFDHLKSNCAALQMADNYIVQGIVKRGNHNGIASNPGFFNIVAETCTGPLQHEHASISQHELTHNIGGIEDTTWPWQHNICIMNYFWMFWGITTWCNSCHNTVWNKIWR